MKFLLISSLLILHVSAQEPPANVPVSSYNNLWQNSPFTDPPEKVDTPKKNDLEDWVLVGLERYSDGNFVTLLNKKDTKQRIRVPGDGSGSEADQLAQEFKILEINPDPEGSGSSLKTEVVLQKGPHRGAVTFDLKYLTVRKAPTPTNRGKTPASATQRKTPPGLPGGATRKTTPTPPKKAPRTRYIPKPNK